MAQRPSRTALSLLCLVFLLPLGARGDEPVPPVAEKPQPQEDGGEDLDQIVAGHARRADEAMRRGQRQVAIDELRSAYQMDPQPVFLFQAGQAYQQAGRRKEALGMFRDFVQKDPQSARRAEADAAIRELSSAPGKDLTPVWKKGWFWAIIGGGVIVAAGIGIGIGLGLRSNTGALE